MNNTRGTDNRTVRFLSFVADILGIISALIVIPPVIAAFFTQSIKIAFFVIPALILAVFVWINRHKIARNTLFYFLSLTAPSKSYKLTEKEVIYEFISRTQMRHEKNFNVKILHTSFQGIDDKYRWTGDSLLKPVPKDQKHFKINMLGAKFGLIRYYVEVLGDKKYSKNNSEKIGVVFEDIKDPDKKSSLHLSTGIFEKTDCLKLAILFDPSLRPINGRRLEYIHYTDDVHYTSDNIEPEYKDGKLCYVWTIKKPLYGGKYMIEWEFKE